MGFDWHSGCLRCERCNKTLTPGSHAVHQNKGYCHKPCYATMFGPKGTFRYHIKLVSLVHCIIISGVGTGGDSYAYEQK